MSFLLGTCLLLAESLPEAALLPVPRAAVLLPHGGFVSSLAFTPDGKALISAGGDRLIRVWDPATGKETARLEGHTAPVLALALTRDGKTLASGGSDRTVRLWDLKGRKHLRNLEGHQGDVMALAFSPEGDSLASASTCTPGEYLVGRRVARQFT
jgi:WD40 repeat protein